MIISTNNERGKARYCERPSGDSADTFGVAEALHLDDGRTLYYIIERVENGSWNYRVHVDGETIAGSPACAGCHDQGKPDPLFRQFRDTACRQ